MKAIAKWTARVVFPVPPFCCEMVITLESMGEQYNIVDKYSVKLRIFDNVNCNYFNMI